MDEFESPQTPIEETKYCAAATRLEFKNGKYQLGELVRSRFVNSSEEVKKLVIENGWDTNKEFLDIAIMKCIVEKPLLETQKTAYRNIKIVREEIEDVVKGSLREIFEILREENTQQV